MTYTMPPEWAPHERTWMAWPTSGYTLGADSTEAEKAFQAWSAVANAIVPFEPVSVLVNPDGIDIARSWLDPAIELVPAPLDDAWMRDMGPTFVVADDGSLAGVDWIFNGWGACSWAKWENDATAARSVCESAGVPIVSSAMVNEGGGIHVDGEGTVLVTRTVQLGEGRNAHWTSQQVEDELRRTLGVENVVWLERGLTRDYDEYGTRGHVDIVACFSDSKTLLFHDQRNPEHPDYEISAQVRALVETLPGLRVIPIPAPDVVRDDKGWVDYSYINHYICNGAVILCAFDDPGDERAAAILREVYPDREIVLVDAREIFALGGGIHCITQQQPKV